MTKTVKTYSLEHLILIDFEPVHIGDLGDAIGGTRTENGSNIAQGNLQIRKFGQFETKEEIII